jgi:hypothetical protein
VDQGFVVSVFVAGAELQVVVQEEADIILPPGNYDSLVRGRPGVDNFIGI